MEVIEEEKVAATSNSLQVDYSEVSPHTSREVFHDSATLTWSKEIGIQTTY